MSEERFHLAGSLEEKGVIIYVNDRQGFSLITVKVQSCTLKVAGTDTAGTGAQGPSGAQGSIEGEKNCRD